MWDINGKELWERHTKSTISHGAIAADINSDGVLEVIFGTLSGHVYAVRGSDGKDTANFPFRTQGRWVVCKPSKQTHVGCTYTSQACRLCGFVQVQSHTVRAVK